MAVLKDKCDIILIPRIMQVRNREYICPKFCGLPEMIQNSIPQMPRIIDKPIYAGTRKKLYSWAKDIGRLITSDKSKIKRAFNFALIEQDKYKPGYNDNNQGLTVALVGHPYNIFDKYINMNIVQKLNKLGVGVITEEFIEETLIDEEVKGLYKRPFWILQEIPTVSQPMFIGRKESME